MLPPRDQLTLCFAHVAYRFADRFALRNTGIRFIEVRSREELDAKVAEADVLVCSGMWRNDLPQIAPKLKFVQSASAGTDQYDREVLKKAGIRLASGQGINANAVSEHAIALMLALLRRIPEARDNQAKHVWRGMMGDFSKREDEAGGKTAVVVGLGRIGGRITRLCKALGMTVVGVRRDVSGGAEGADEVHSFRDLKPLLPRADFLILACPLTDETRGLIDAEAIALLKPTAQVINVARGRVVDEAAISAALAAHRIKGAALDVTADEPLPATSPLWDMPHVLITPHTGGETHMYEDNVLDFMMENIARLQRGEATLVNQIV
ncbi:D-2-hydroxyacid dehydrogenase [Neoroseomonas oryzicola]|uniref:D-2-hydroxyacid dehydrogenase n=1 Tax=Neoroseomonas oryzicola TaxID=535904 RepID=A0A9X9WBS3_9PROT|nr:D-2-hydroxyacid dehydrogenase [Neoroseomonas oryzicola]MBR0657783.1 D-2-hydroxyacid dehydrogenase [Neoroseomonas oryzicola]NKE18649.1 D-2-hydroxyacid dehydrogenase [Neoroseomonas oryzicola]